MGLENEYGITVIDERGRASDLARVAQIVAKLAERYLNQFDNPIGGRLYRDGSDDPEMLIDHFEGCTPECAGEYAAKTLALYNRALDIVVLEQFRDVCRKMRSAGELNGLRAHLIKGSTDWKGHWYGSQLNIRVPKVLNEGVLTDYLVPFLATCVVWAGQGGVMPVQDKVKFVFSPRTISFDNLRSTSTYYNRPFICTARFGDMHSHDLPQWNRLQLLCDPMISDFVTYVYAGMISLLIRLICRGGLPEDFPCLPTGIYADAEMLKNFFKDVRCINEDPSLTARLRLNEGEAFTALEIQRKYFKMISGSSILLDFTAEDKMVLRLFGKILEDLGTDPLRLIDRCSCWMLYRLCRKKLKESSARWSNCHKVAVEHKGKSIRLSTYLSLLDYQVTGLDEWGIWPRMISSGRVKTLFSEKEAADASLRPPSSRAAFRKKVFDRARELGLYVRMYHQDSWSKVMFGPDDSSSSVELLDPTGRLNEPALRQAENIMQRILKRSLTGI